MKVSPVLRSEPLALNQAAFRGTAEAREQRF